MWYRAVMNGLGDILRARGSLGDAIWTGIALLGLGVLVCWGLPLLLLAIIFFA